MCGMQEVREEEANELEGDGYEHIPEERKECASGASLTKEMSDVGVRGGYEGNAHRKSTIISPTPSEEKGAWMVVSQ